MHEIFEWHLNRPIRYVRICFFIQFIASIGGIKPALTVDLLVVF